MRPASPPANPVRSYRPSTGLWRAVLPRFLRGDTPARVAHPPAPVTPADLAAAIVAAPAFNFPAAPETVVQADDLLNLYRRAIAAHDDGSGYSKADIAKREEALRNRLPQAWSDLQNAARRFLSVVEAQEAGR